MKHIRTRHSFGAAALLLAAAAAAFTARADFIWNGAAGDGLMSTAGNWTGGAAPSAAVADNITLDLGPATIMNDIGPLPVNSLKFRGSCQNTVLEGDPIVVRTQISDNSSLGTLFTFNCPIICETAPKGTREITVHSGRKFVFNKMITEGSVTNSYFNFSPQTDAEIVIAGGMKFTRAPSVAVDYQNRLSGAGRLIVASFVDVPYWCQTGGSLVITNGGTFHLQSKQTYSTQFRNATVEVCKGGRFYSTGALIIAQEVKSTTRIYVRDGGIFETGSYFRFANNGLAILTIEKGGLVLSRANGLNSGVSENGCGQYIIDGGIYRNGDKGDGTLWVGHGFANATAVGYYKTQTGRDYDNFILFKNGGFAEVGYMKMKNGQNAGAEYRSSLKFDGGGIRAGAATTTFFVTSDSSTPQYLDAYILSNPAIFDTNGRDVTWNIVALEPSPELEAGETDGGFVKSGLGTLTFEPSSATFTGPVVVSNGTFLAKTALASSLMRVEAGAAASYDAASRFTGALVLKEGASFKPAFTTAGALSFSSLASTGGEVTLAVADASSLQTLSLGDLDVSGRFAFRLVSAADGSTTFSDNGTYTLAAYSGTLVGSADDLSVANPVYGKTYSFTAANGVVSLTISGDAAAAPALVIDRDGGGNVRAITVNSGDQTIADDLQITAATRVTVASGASLAFTGSLTGAGTLVLDGEGAVSISSSAHPDVVVKGGTFTDPSTESPTTFTFSSSIDVGDRMFTGQELVYQGAGAASLDNLHYSAATTLRLDEGSGSLTLGGRIEPRGGSPLSLYSRDDAEMILGGDYLAPTWGDAVYRDVYFKGGRFRFASGSRWYIMTTHESCLQFGGGTEPVHVTIDDGAQLWTEMMAFRQGSDAATPVVVEQNGGDVRIIHGNGNSNLHETSGTNEMVYVLNGGTFDASLGSWLNFGYRGPMELQVNGGEATLGHLAFGQATSTSGWNGTGRGAKLKVTGGSASVTQRLCFMSDWNKRNDFVYVGGGVRTNGVLAIPASVRSVPFSRTENFGGIGSLVLDGARLRLTGIGADGIGSLTNYLSGADSIAVGEGGARIETAFDGEATICMPVRSRTASDGGFEKTGPGTLVLAASNNVVFGAIDVKEGTLKARFVGGERAVHPEGLVINWDFDGEDPYADSTGHGFDLSQAFPETPVAFTNENALCGKSAFWEVGGAALKMGGTSGFGMVRHTVNLWVRFKNWTNYKSHRGVFSTRVNSAITGHAGSFDIAFKGLNDGSDIIMANAFFGVNGANLSHDQLAGFNLEKWHMITIVREVGTVTSYIDGEKKTTAVTTRTGDAFLSSGYLITLGMNIANSEMLNAGTMIDDVSIYGRALTDDEVLSLYAGACCTSRPPVIVAADATWDMNGGALTTSRLSGGGTISNGVLTVDGAIAPSRGGVLKVGRLAVASADGVVDLGREVGDPIAVPGVIPVVEFEELDAETAANVAHWRVVNTGVVKPMVAHVRVDAAESKIVVETTGNGTMLIFR
jgi:autotransporter-associated beta strand protein